MNRKLNIWLVITILLCHTGAMAQTSQGVTGTVRYHRGVTGEGLKERDVVVWLPPGYEQGKQRYPVLYLQDGQNVFDPSTSAFGKEWRADETADSLVRADAIKPMIIVAIYNTPDRNKEYLPWEKNQAYKDFLVKKLKPFIDTEYRTRKDARYNYIGGASAGGILAFMMVWEYPEVFSKAMCMSPAFRNPDGFKEAFNIIPDVREGARRPRHVFFYIDNGGKDLDQLLQPGVDELIAALTVKAYRAGKDFVFIKDLQATHNEEAWAKRLPDALIRIQKAKLPR